MNPSADVLALTSIEIDISTIELGQNVTFTWRSHPLFVRRRTSKEIAITRAVKVADLIDPVARNANLPDSAPATDQNRETKPEWLVVVGVCIPLGCIPEASTLQYPQGDYGGYLCHCHGSQYDSAGRVRVGPAPQNLAVPRYRFLSNTRLRIG
jgi:ubiquinol-cytochrome c reductase iron-sulfur subunit